MRERKEKLERENAEVLQAHAAAVQRLAEVQAWGSGRRSRSSLWWVLRGGAPVCQESGIVVVVAHAVVKERQYFPGGVSPSPDAHDLQGRHLGPLAHRLCRLILEDPAPR